jgi:uncharacterized protein (DUF58 family)
VVVFLNVATYPRHWMGFNPELLERAVSVSASIASYSADQRWSIGVFANGSVPRSDQPIRVPPGRSPDQLLRVLEALAAVTEFATGSIELLMNKESSSLPWSATFVLVTGVITEEMLAGLIRLKVAGRRVTLVSLADEPPPKDLPGILAYHVPARVRAFRRAAPSGSETEVALGSIPAPEPLELELEQTITGSSRD